MVVEVSIRSDLICLCMAICLKCLVTFLSGVNLYMKRNRVYSKIGGPPKHWLWGHLKVYTHDRKGLLEHSKRMIKFPKMQAIWLGPFLGGISAYWPSVVGRVLSADTPKDHYLYRYLESWVGKALITSKGKLWKRNRRLLAPAFHNDVIKNYMNIFNESANAMIKRWNAKTKVDVYEDMSLVAFNIIVRCATSAKLNYYDVESDRSYLKAARVLADITVERFSHITYLFDFIFNRTASRRKFDRALNLTHGRLDAIIEERLKVQKSTGNKSTRCDFMHTLLMARDKTGAGLSKEQVRNELSGIYLGGHGTLSSAFSWTLYHLALHQEHQDKCRKEVAEVLGEKDELSWEDLQSLPFLTMCIKESLRMVPPVAFIARELTRPMKFERDFNADQYNTSPDPVPNAVETLPKGTRVEIKIYNIHHNPHLWDDPECYNPYRFARENADKIKPFSFIPFSSGAQGCIAKNFAMAELRTVFSLFLNSFKFTIDPDFPTPILHPKLFLRSANGIRLKVEKIE